MIVNFIVGVLVIFGDELRQNGPR